MLFRIIIIMWLCCVGICTAAASGDIPLAWTSVRIESDDRGGAKLLAAVDADGELSRLDLTIRGKDVAIAPHCLAGLVQPYLNAISISYGETLSGQPYWSIRVPYDGTGTVSLASVFHLVVNAEALVWSYQSVQLDERTWEDRDICPLKAGALDSSWR